MNNKTVIRNVLIITLATLTGYAEMPKERVVKKSPLTVQERMAAKAERQRRYEIENGGDAIRAGSMRGSILLANAQKIVDPFELEEVREYFWENTGYNIILKSAQKVGPSEAAAELNKSGSAVGIFIVEDAALPVLLVAPEDHWAIVNVTRLAVGAKNPIYIAKRVQKEVARAIVQVCGGSAGVHGDSLMGALRTVDDLDRYPDINFPLDVLARFEFYLRRLGVTPAIRMPYDQAVMTDWCPAPTNNYQKRIWENVHGTPSNPMKIEFDPKKGR